MQTGRVIPERVVLDHRANAKAESERRKAERTRIRKQVRVHVPFTIALLRCVPDSVACVVPRLRAVTRRLRLGPRLPQLKRRSWTR